MERAEGALRKSLPSDSSRVMEAKMVPLQNRQEAAEATEAGEGSLQPQWLSRGLPG